MLIGQASIEQGANNLLINCAELTAGARLLIVSEGPDYDYYDPKMVTAVAEVARGISANVIIKKIAFDPTTTSVNAELHEVIEYADKTVFLSRLGDQLRFGDLWGGKRTVISYALDCQMLGSAYGTSHYHAFTRLKAAIDRMLMRAESIVVTCPKGTRFAGKGLATGLQLQDVGITRFPMQVFAPIPASGFSGMVALPGFLVGTGSKYYHPYALQYEGQLFAHFKDNRIEGFSGTSSAVAAAKTHYQSVADKFNIDRDFVHSWHAGIHPSCAFPGPAKGSFERWSGSAFGNPRLLHFHTCGAYPPGEICWNVVDPTICVDGIAVWKDGKLHAEAIAGGAEILLEYSCVRAAFAAPSRQIGL